MKDEGRTEKEWMTYCLDLQKQNPILEKEFLKRQQQGEMGVIHQGGKGDIPILFARGTNLARAWENSMVAMWARGGFIRTQYDDKNPKTGKYIVAPSKDCTMHWVVEEPLSEPRIHREFPGGPNDLEEYVQEVVDGIKDSWIRDPNNHEDERWEYTYHERIFEYKVQGLDEVIDQFQIMVKNLARSPITRRAQIVSWKPWEDSQISDPACFQSLWGRILRAHPKEGFETYSDEETGEPKLNLNGRFRSWDGYGASFMNVYAFTELAAKMAEEISQIRGEEVTLGRIDWQGDSFHVYGRDFERFTQRFGKSLQTRHFLEEGDYDTNARTWKTTSPVVQMGFEDAKREIPEKLRIQSEKYAQGKGLTKDSTKLFGNP